MLAKNNGIDLLSLALILRQGGGGGSTTDAVARAMAQAAQITADGAVSDIVDLADTVDGKSDKTEIIHISDPVVSLTLADNTALQCEVVTNVTITLGNGTYTDGYAGDISFTSGATATNWNVPTPLFTGTDCEDNVFVPQSSKRYNVSLWYDGSYVIGVVLGNEITIS